MKNSQRLNPRWQLWKHIRGRQSQQSPYPPCKHVELFQVMGYIEYPDLDIAHYLEQLDVLARRVRALLALPTPDVLPQLPPGIEPLTVLHALNDVLFKQEHF